MFIRRFLESLWLVSTGLDSNGLSSLITIIVMSFSLTLLFPIANNKRKNLNRFFKEVFIILFIWIFSSFSAALFHQPRHASIGLIPVFFYVFIRLSLSKSVGLRIVFEKYSYPDSLPKGNSILMWLAPTPRIFISSGIGLRSILKVLKKEARIVIKTPEEIFVRSFSNVRVFELQGSLASFVRVVVEGWRREAAILCEAKPIEGFFKLRVKIASDDMQVLNNIAERFTKLDYEEDLKWAFEKWLSLKPCVKPIELSHNNSLLQPERIPERIIVTGAVEEAEKFALQACLSQLRNNSTILIVDGCGDPVFGKTLEKLLGGRDLRHVVTGLKNSYLAEGLKHF